MAFKELISVDEADFYEILTGLRDVRAESSLRGRDPWAFRQALITVMAIDTAVALESGIEPDGLALFDARAEDKAREFIEYIPEERRAHGREA